MLCPCCSSESLPNASGPYDLSNHVTGVVLLVCPDCNHYTAAVCVGQPADIGGGRTLASAATTDRS